MENNGIETLHRRLAYRIGDRLPKAIRIIYYILLAITLVYWLYRFIRMILDLIQKIGSFMFDKRNYYTFVICLLILCVGVLIASQFIFGLDPIGKLGNWIIEQWDKFRQWCINLIS